MSWLPSGIFWTATLTPVVWLWTGETREPDTNQALLVVLVMILGGALATILFVTSIGSATVMQLFVGTLSLVMYLVLLGYFGFIVGVSNVLRMLFSALPGDG